MTSKGGQFRLCWCSTNCSIAEHFRTDFGTLTIIGPQPDQDKTCIAGLSCTMDGISGTHLASTNVFAVLDTCGRQAKTFPALQWSQPEHTLQLSTAPSTPGQYRLCWCVGTLELPMRYSETSNFTEFNKTILEHNLSAVTNITLDSPCRIADDFQVDVGGLLIVGATPIHNDFTCIAGQRCELDDVVTGLYVEDEDSINCTKNQCVTVVTSWYHNSLVFASSRYPFQIHFEMSSKNPRYL